MQIHALLQLLSAPAVPPALAALYGADAPRQQKRWLAIATTFAERFPTALEVELFSAPGRSEISGNHTDHNRGKVLAAGVNLDVVAVAAKTTEPRVLEQSVGHPLNDICLDDLRPFAEERGHSSAMIRGICKGLQNRGYSIGGFVAATASEVLGGSGLSSSAAYEALIGTILNHFYNQGAIPALAIAQIGQFAENEYFGKPSGLMDQTACSLGGFVAIDFADVEQPKIQKIAFDFAGCGYALCVVNSGGSHADLTDDYAAVRAEMLQVAAALGKPVLRETQHKDFLAQLPALRATCGDRALLRAMHFYAENDRVDAQTQALQQNDFARFLRLANQSGRSSFMYNQNVFSAKTPAQPVALALALSETLLAGRGAFRVHGGGFAGTIQAFVPNDRLAMYRAGMEAVFGSGSCFALQVRPQGGIHVAL